jgi:hypothetical protein
VPQQALHPNFRVNVVVQKIEYIANRGMPERDPNLFPGLPKRCSANTCDSARQLGICL